MQPYLKIGLVLAVFGCASLPEAEAVAAEKRVALVVGNASYKAKPLATAANDASLVSQTLQAAGFDVIGARDLDDGMLRQTLRDFIARITNAGPDTVAVVYFAGYGLQSEGENYLLPIGTEITDISELPARALRLSELMNTLAALRLKTAFIILDAARAGQPILSGLAGGLAWVETEKNILIAFNAAPGTVARDVGDGYGPYAKALAEMIGEGNLTPANLFDRVRLRVHELTRGGQVPWDASKIQTQFKFFERDSNAPIRSDGPERIARMRSQTMRALGALDAYMIALTRDTFDAYADFLADYWQDPMTRRVRALLAARREAITWRRTCQANAASAYWSYLERYPRGPHAAEAGRLLSRLGAANTAPPKFPRLDYEVPPPLPDELEYLERPLLMLDDPVFAFEAPQPTPGSFLEPASPELLNPKLAVGSPQGHALPVVTLAPLPSFVHIPAYVLASKQSVPEENREILSMRPAIGLPTEPVKPAANSSISSPVPATQKDRAEIPRLPSVVPKAAQIDNAGQLTPENAEPREAGTASASPSPATVSPSWLKNVAVPASRGIVVSDLPADSSIARPTSMVLATVSASLTMRTWNNGVVSPAPTTSNQPQTRLTTTPAQSQTVVPSQTTGSISQPKPRPVRPPSTTAASVSPRTGITQPKPSKKPSPITTNPSAQPARTPKDSSGVSALQP